MKKNDMMHSGQGLRMQNTKAGDAPAFLYRSSRMTGLFYLYRIRRRLWHRG